MGVPFVVRTDLARLRTRITVPDCVEGAVWGVRPLGPLCEFVSGPTDTEQWAFLTPRPSGEGAASTVEVPTEVATALLPVESLTHAPETGGARRVVVRTRDASSLGRGRYHGAWACAHAW